MATRPTIKLKVKSKPAPVEELEEFEDAELEDELDDGEDLGDESGEGELEEDEPEYEPPTKKKFAPPPAKKHVAPPLVKKVAPPVAKHVQPPAKKQVAPPPQRKPKLYEPEVEADEVEDSDLEKFGGKFAKKAAAEPVHMKKVDQHVVEGLLTGIMDALAVGNAVTLTRTADSSWQIATGVASKPKLSGKALDAEVCTPEYLEWEADWHTLTYEEKLQRARKLKAKWEAHEDERVNTIRMAQAVKAVLGIEKYKAEYRTNASRNALSK